MVKVKKSKAGKRNLAQPDNNLQSVKSIISGDPLESVMDTKDEAHYTLKALEFLKDLQTNLQYWEPMTNPVPEQIRLGFVMGAVNNHLDRVLEFQHQLTNPQPKEG